MVSFWRVFRLIFVIFSLYLVADAIYRWSSFRQHSSFAEILPSIALITLLWSMVAVLMTIVIWFILRSVQWLSKYVVKTDHLTSCTGFFLLCAAMVFQGKKLILPYVETSFQMKLMILCAVFILSICLSLLFHGKIEKWMRYIHNQITIWVWLFGIWTLFSTPVVFYHTWIKDSGQTVSKETSDVSFDAEKSRPNIILFTFDGLSAHDMSLYGYERETTPFITQWSKGGTVFTNVKAASSLTVPATTSLMTGKRPWTHQRYQPGIPVRNNMESLPSLLKNAGYYNMAFVANFMASVHEMGMINSFMVAPHSIELISPNSISASFKKYLCKLFCTKIKLHDWIIFEDFILRTYTPDNYFRNQYETEFPVKVVSDTFLTEIDNNLREPFFAWIHVVPPHYPYLPPKEYSGLFDSSQKLRLSKSQDALFGPLYYSQDQQPDADILRARYDEFIKYCDTQFQDFIKQLTQRDLLKRTAIILSADHGESFEHNMFAHQTNFYEQVTHIPLIIQDPGQREGRILDDIVEQIDISATILDFANISVPSWVEGRSLVPLMHGKELPSKPAFAMFLEPRAGSRIQKDVIAVWEGDYKLITYVKEGRYLLFNLREDPEELENLFEKKPVVGDYLLELIQDNLKKANKRR